MASTAVIWDRVGTSYLMRRWRWVVEGIAVTGVYALLAVVLLYPLFSHPASTVIDALAMPHGWLVMPDVYLNIWVKAWDWHALTTVPWTLFDANIFYPAPDALACSEHMLGHVPIFGPVYALSGNPVLANQVNLLLSFALCGAAMYAWLRHWRVPAPAAFFGGFVYAFCPVRAYDVGHAQLLSGQYLPLALLFFDRTLTRQRPADAAAFGAFLLWQMLCSYYLAYMTATAMTGYALGVLWVTRGRLRRRGVGLALAAAVIAGVLFVALSLPYLRLKEMGVISTYDQSWWPYATGSDLWRNYLYPPGLIRHLGLKLDRGGILYVGLLAAACAMVAMLPRRDRFRVAVPWARAGALGAGFACYVMALGPLLIVGGRALPLPYGWAVRFVPGFSSMRVSSRFALAVMVGFAPLAALGWARVSGWFAKGRTSAEIALLVVAVGCTAFEYDFLGRQYFTREILVDDSVIGVYRALAALPPGPVVELPGGTFPGELMVLTTESRYMFYSTFHWHPLLNGYSGYRPPSYDPVFALARALPDARAMAILGRMTGLRYIVLHTFELSPDRRRLWSAPAGLRHVGTYGTDMLYEVVQPPPPDLRDELVRSGPRQTTFLGTALAPVTASGRHAALSLRLPVAPIALPGLGFPLELWVTNNSVERWPSLSLGTEHLVMVGYRWTDSTGRVVSEAPQAGRLPYDLTPGESSPAVLSIVAPQVPGSYRLQVGVVQDGEWFPEPLAALPVTIPPAPASLAR
ncbi:MAG: hypothetical protein ACHQ9S_02715 [Candidatus Binatia bacterium]